MARKNGQILGRDMRIWLVRLGYWPVCARLQLELLYRRMSLGQGFQPRWKLIRDGQRLKK